jgi:DNA-binding LacI/PurR family transcriptional regulator
MGREIAQLLVDTAIPGTAESSGIILDTHLVVRDTA